MLGEGHLYYEMEMMANTSIHEGKRKSEAGWLKNVVCQGDECNDGRC